MKSELAEKLFSICGSADLYATYGYNDIKSITQLTEEQRIEIESLLIDASLSGQKSCPDIEAARY